MVANRFATHLFRTSGEPSSSLTVFKTVLGSVDTQRLQLYPADSENDDLLDFTIEVLDPLNNREISNVGVGREVLVGVSVDDLKDLNCLCNLE